MTPFRLPYLVTVGLVGRGCRVRHIAFPSPGTSLSLYVFICRVDAAAVLLFRPAEGYSRFLVHALRGAGAQRSVATGVITVDCDHDRCPCLDVDGAREV